jgi:hypothetical protein
MMKKILIGLCLSVSMALSVVMSVRAETPDPLWLKVIAHQQVMKNWVAKDIEQVMVAQKPDNETKTVKLKKQLSGWEKNKPVYTLVSMEPPSSNPDQHKKIPDMMEMFGNTEDQLFSKETSIKRSNGQLLEGKNTVLFETSTSGMKMKLWVEPETGMWVKREVDMEVMFTLEGKISTSFQLDANGLALPKTNQIKLNILIPFKKAKVDMLDTYQNWVKRS